MHVYVSTDELSVCKKKSRNGLMKITHSLSSPVVQLPDCEFACHFAQTSRPVLTICSNTVHGFVNVISSTVNCFLVRFSNGSAASVLYCPALRRYTSNVTF